MTNKFAKPQEATLEQVSILVEDTSESFVAFDTWMDGQLDQLVARWIHTAAPNAGRLSLNRRGGSDR